MYCTSFLAISSVVAINTEVCMSHTVLSRHQSIPPTTLARLPLLNQAFSQQSMHKWLFLIARTTVADYWRAHYRGPSISLDELLEAGWEGPTEEEPAAITSEPADRVQHLLRALPEQYREVLTCRFLLNLSIKATALRMGLTVSNVKVLQFRALERAAHLEQVVAEQPR